MTTPINPDDLLLERALFVQRLNDWAESITKDKKCPNCKNKGWVVPTEIVQIFRFSGGGLQIGGPIYPFILLICNKCGYTEFYNAAVAGFTGPKNKNTPKITPAGS